MPAAEAKSLDGIVRALISHLVPELHRRFSDRGPIVEPGELAPQVRFPAIHPDVGDIVIEDYADEFTVFYGQFTHTHHGRFKAETSEGVDDAVASVVQELTAVFENRMKMWGDRRGGTLAPIDYKSYRLFGLFTIFKPRGRVYVWSGPIDDAA